jgi:UPF0042 nucleotide-binding protein
VGLLPQLVAKLVEEDAGNRLAVGVDARNTVGELRKFPGIVDQLRHQTHSPVLFYLDANDETLMRRFSETRRKHPLTNQQTSLSEAIKKESQLLAPIVVQANLRVETSNLTLHQFRDLVRQRLMLEQDNGLALLFESFGFKAGIPHDADMVFDVRCLPNPYWKPALRGHSGKEQIVIDFLTRQPEVVEMISDIERYLVKWLPRFAASNRSYLTVAIGCTGGQHRSVYISEQLALRFADQYPNVQVRHRQIN